MVRRIAAAMPGTRSVLLTRRAHGRARRVDQDLERSRPALHLNQDPRPDHRPHLPVLLTYLRTGSLAEGGRGLQVVDALAARWGSFRAARAQVVWCDLGQPLPAATVEAWAWLNNLLARSDLGPGPAEPRPTEASAARHAIPQPAGPAPSCRG